MAEESASRESLSQLLNNSNRFEYSACFFSDEDTSSTGTNVSRLITEEDIVDTMFDMCDTNKTGTVPVSTLIEMLKSTTGSLSAESQQYLDDLALIFDPEGKDVSIELEVYREGMMQWIKEIKERSAGVDDDNCKLISVSPEKCSSPQVNTSPHQRVLEHLNGISFGSLEASGCAGDASTHEWDIMELSNKVADLQYHNKKLTDENIKLQVQLENAEESSTLSAQEMEGLKKQLRNMQRIMEKNRELQHEVTDVKNSLALSEENTKVLQKKLAITERENSNLEAQLDQLQKELIQTNCDLDAAKTTHNELLGSLTDFKRCKETEEMKATLDQWKRISEGLRQEKNELELQLIQTQHSMHMQCDELVGDESSIVSENEKELITRSLFPSASSTPFSSKLPSIHFELKNLIQSEKDLPSPFCEKALIDDVFSSDIGDDEGETVFDNLKPCDLFNDMKSVDLVEECRHNKDLVLEQLDLLSKPQGAQKTEDEHLNVTEITRQQLLQETEDFSKVIVELAKTKRASDLRVTKLAGALKRLKDKNIEIKRKHKEALKQMQDDSISLNLSVEELTELRERYEVEKSNRENIEKQLEDKEKQLTVAKEDAKGLSQTLEEMHTRKTSLENIIAELKRTNNELQEKCRVKEGLVSSLEEELAKSVNIAREEKEKTLSLQKSNVEEIQGIWNTLQSHLNPERENSAQLPVGVEAVKNQACQDIQKLRNQLKKTKGILACVKSKTFLQPGLTTTVQLESTSETDVQTSQLIDALDLESSFQKRISSLCNFCSGRGSSQSQCLVKSCQQLSIQGRRPFFTGTQNKRKPPLLQDFGCQGSEGNTGEDVKEILDLRSKINSAAGFKSENYEGLVDIMAHCSSRICGQLFPDDRSSRPLLHSSSRLSALMEEELSDTEADSTPVKMEPSGSSLPGPSRLGSSDGDLSSARRKRLAMKDREKRETLGSSMEDKTFKLVNGKVEEMELTEADRKVNAQLLEEAAKASQASSLRRRRSSDPDRKSLHPARVPQVIHSSSSSTQRADKPVGRDRSPEQGSEHKPNIQSDQPKPHEEYNGMDHEVPPLVKIVVSDTNVPKRESSPRRFLLHPSMPAVPERLMPSVRKAVNRLRRMNNKPMEKCN
ncbi:lymphoid-restricted membrane protein [Lingula anatina]|uniref:Lymphoid-restricted membrane protein n=1 Tax=Lingula anatina TaxID=7574 RepID=A0A2R2MJZ7_LINAN|nr:lymphoid-restricted membrane protein [Lingula anatina]|eukprot:XP_023930520.1 lymphoid-restricted membrane protein [Lingula anatina]